MGRSAQHWFVITPEYPPSPGGVSDYTQLVAEELARRGHGIDVWAPPPREGAFPSTPGVRCHALPDGFGLASMRALDAALARAPAGTIVFVQYVPSGFGARSMNVPFALWLGRRKERRWMMVHEAAFPYRHGARLRHQLLATVTRIMLRAALIGAERVFTSTPAWEPLIRRHGFARGPVDWLPVPATVPSAFDPEHVQRIRHELGATPERLVIGHFGSYGSLVAEPLASTIALVSARHPEWVWLLLGRNGDRFAAELQHRTPRPAAVFARAGLAPAEVSNHLAAADVAVFPFPDGISARRTSAMAALAVGTPLVTTRGPSMEAFWDHSEAIAIADNDPDALARATVELALNPRQRALLAVRSRSLYLERFDVGRLADTLTRSLEITLAKRAP
jgi:glycosyltransferase involved in cell wall biosynthesis